MTHLGMPIECSGGCGAYVQVPGPCDICRTLAQEFDRKEPKCVHISEVSQYTEPKQPINDRDLSLFERLPSREYLGMVTVRSHRQKAAERLILPFWIVIYGFLLITEGVGIVTILRWIKG
jgi:hypothetical protein